jgi:hypothetical protein
LQYRTTLFEQAVSVAGPAQPPSPSGHQMPSEPTQEVPVILTFLVQAGDGDLGLL